MSFKAVVTGYSNPGVTAGGMQFNYCFVDLSTQQVAFQNQDFLYFGTDIVNFTPDECINLIQANIIAYGAANGYPVTAADFQWIEPNQFTKTEVASIKAGVVARSFNNAASTSFVTVAAAANGSRISTTRDAIVNYSFTLTSTASLAGAQTGYIVLEICPTNSATAGDWIEIGRTPNGASVALAIALTAVSIGGGQVGGVIPSGYYSRRRFVTVSGTPTCVGNSAQEVLI